jgi:hypothetical protein
LANKFPHIDNLILGNYHGDYMRHFQNRVTYNRVLLVDDGTDILRFTGEQISISKNTGEASASRRRSMAFRYKTRIRKRRLLWDNRVARSITFFTAYELRVRDSDILVKNDYAWFRAKVAESIKEDSCFFLGQPLVKDKAMNRDIYLDYVGKVRSYFAGKRFYYIPHPREPEFDVIQVKHILGIEIKRIDVPIEWYLIKSEVRPSVLAAFYCSALISCAAIFGDEYQIKAFYIKLSDILRIPESVEAAYQQFAKRENPTIEVIRL